MPSKNEVVVTGIGLVSPLGSSVSEFRQRMFSGDSGLQNIRGSLVSKNFPIPYAGWVDRSKLPAPAWSGARTPPTRTVSQGSVPEPIDANNLSDSALFAILATEQILDNIPDGAPIDAIVYGTAESIGYDLVQRSLLKTASLAEIQSASAEKILQMIANMLEEAGKGAVPAARLISINSACASGNQAIGLAMQRIRDGNWTRAVVGGVDTRCNASNLMNFNMLGALSTADVPAEQASRPFSGDRCGFVRGEGAATLILESRKTAEARGANILGVISGYGFTSDSYRLTDGREDGIAVVKAMNTAIEDAGLNPEDIDTVSAHGTSTLLNDRLESKAIGAVFGDTAKTIAVTSLKSQIGHTTVAAGAIESISCLLMLEEQRLAPTMNYKVKDPNCDLDFVPNASRPANIQHILSNNFGFGGQNACLVISHGNHLQKQNTCRLKRKRTEEVPID